MKAIKLIVVALLVIALAGFAFAADTHVLRKGSLGRDKLFDMFDASVNDHNLIKNAVDNSDNADITGLSSIANETSADLTTDSTALSVIANETSADLTTDSTALALLVNEISVDYAAIRLWMLGMNATYNAHIINTVQAAGGLIHNGGTGIPMSNAIPGVLTAPIVNASTRTAPVVTPTTRTATVVTPTTIANVIGTLGATTEND